MTVDGIEHVDRGLSTSQSGVWLGADSEETTREVEAATRGLSTSRLSPLGRHLRWGTPPRWNRTIAAGV